MLIRPVRRPILGPTGEPVSVGGSLPWDGVGGGGGAAEAPLTIAGLYAWWRMDDKTLNATDVSAVTDKSGNARHLVQATSGNQPLWDASSANLNGQPSAVYTQANSDHLEHGTASTWKLLHDGTGCTGAAVFYSEEATDQTLGICGTNRGAAAIGHTIWFDGANQDVTYFVHNGTASIILATSAGGTVPRSAAHYMTWGYQESASPTEYWLRIDGTTVISGDSLAAPSTSNPAHPLAWGALSETATLPFEGELPELILYSTHYAAASAEVASLEAYLAARYGI